MTLFMNLKGRTILFVWLFLFYFTSGPWIILLHFLCFFKLFMGTRNALLWKLRFWYFWFSSSTGLCDKYPVLLYFWRMAGVRNTESRILWVGFLFLLCQKNGLIEKKREHNILVLAGTPFLKLNKIDEIFQEHEMKISLDLKIFWGRPWQVPECCCTDVVSMDSKDIQSYAGYLIFIEAK